MIIKNKWIVSICLGVIAVVSLLIGNQIIAATATGGLVGWLAGEKNGEKD